MNPQKISLPETQPEPATSEVVVGTFVLASWVAAWTLWKIGGDAWLASPAVGAWIWGFSIGSLALWAVFGLAFLRTESFRDARTFLSVAIGIGLLQLLGTPAVRMEIGAVNAIPPEVLASVGAFSGILLLLGILLAACWPTGAQAR